jgi:lipoprotein-anchoring transpeptidase ErfK/SrfK
MRYIPKIFCLLTVVFSLAAPALAQDGVHVAPGVSVAGVDLSGLSSDQTRIKLQQAVTPLIANKVTVQVGSKSSSISSATAKVDLQVGATTAAALAAAPGTSVAPAITVSNNAVTAWTAAFAKKVAVKARDAKLTIKIKKMKVRKAKSGKRISNASVVAAVTKAFVDPSAPRTITPKLLTATPRTTDKELRKQYATVLTVSQKEFKVHLFKHFKLVKTYGIAVGSPAHPTPKGRFKILDKAVNPTWNVPNSPWAGELQGTTVEGGSAQNPLKARWMGIGNGIGFHGTGEDYSIGSRASHGCMRMHVKDVIKLYPRVPIGTTVVIK